MCGLRQRGHEKRPRQARVGSRRSFARRAERNRSGLSPGSVPARVRMGRASPGSGCRPGARRAARGRRHPEKADRSTSANR